MRFKALKLAVCLGAAASLAGAAEPGMNAPSLTVGRNLQVCASILLKQPAPQTGFQLTLTSADPARLLLSSSPEKAGTATLNLAVKPGAVSAPEFCLQARASEGSVTYTASAPGLETSTGVVTLAPSGIAILGPGRANKFLTTPRSAPSKLTLIAAVLDSSHKIIEEQQVAGGLQAEVELTSSNPPAGKSARITLNGGLTTAAAYFQPAAEGETILKPVPPSGFSAPAEYDSVTAMVAKPGIAIVDDVYLGKNLQIKGVLCLGEAAPPEGLVVKFVSSDGSKLAVSAREDQVGSASASVTVPAGKLTAPFYLNGLADSGQVTYLASAPGYRDRSATVKLTRSGVIVAYEHYGAPDEAAVLRKTGLSEDRQFYVSMAEAKEKPVRIVAWTVYLDPEHNLAADMTVQELAPGKSVTVRLDSSDPRVGTVESPLTIKPGASSANAKFVAVGKGKTIISVDVPEGFSKPANATQVPAIVAD